jgi:hypothetical protein
MLRLTLDTNCVIHAAQAQPYGPPGEELVDLTPRPGRPVDHRSVHRRPGTGTSGQAAAQPVKREGEAIEPHLYEFRDDLAMSQLDSD